MKPSAKGQILPIVMMCLLVMSIIIYGMVSWIQNDTRWAVKEQKSTSAINLAEAAIDRGTWKLQSTTSTWNAAAAGQAVAGYHFDTTYYDIPGGSYRIRFSSAANQCVTVIGEGRDSGNKETRAIQAMYQNQAIYSPLMAGSMINWSRGLGVFWGPIMSQGNIQLMDDFVATWYFPRKFAKGVVIGTAANPRDTNGLNPPNTDNIEWWSEYPGVPNVPVLDFVALRSSASATGTLNIYGCKNSTRHGKADDVTPVPDQGTIAGAAPWDLRGSCDLTAGDNTPHNQHFGDSTNFILANGLDPAKDYVWYWDNDVTLTGAFCGSNPCTPGQSTGLRGTIVVRGNLTIDSSGDLVYSGHVPANAWKEHQKLLINTYDSSNANEYPADIGLNKSTGTFGFGTDTFNVPGSGSGWKTTVGIKGFTYVGGNLTILNYLDFNGAVWINGAVNASGGDAQHFCGIFYDDTLSVPALNVILLRQSWQEVGASPTAWP